MGGAARHLSAQDHDSEAHSHGLLRTIVPLDAMQERSECNSPSSARWVGQCVAPHRPFRAARPHVANPCITWRGRAASKSFRKNT